jgi:transcriptional antiterminator NusG
MSPEDLIEAATNPDFEPTEQKKETKSKGPKLAPGTEIKIEEEEEKKAPTAEQKAAKVEGKTIFALRTTANREDQVMDFLTSNITRKKLDVFSVIRAHGMRGYIFLEAATRQDAEQAAHNIPYARGILPKEISYNEIEHMIEPVKRDLNILKNDIVEIISGPFKRETAKITRIDEQKEEVVVELVEAAVPIPITLKIDAVKVIRRDTDK